MSTGPDGADARAGAIDQSLHIDVVDTIEGFDRLRDAWDRLLLGGTWHTPFHSFEWCRLVREHLVQQSVEKVGQQQQEADRCETVVQQRVAETGQRRAAVARNRRKIDALQDDLRQWRIERERELDDQQDEESEDLTTAAWVAAQQAAGAQEREP